MIFTIDKKHKVLSDNQINDDYMGKKGASRRTQTYRENNSQDFDNRGV